MPELKHFTSLGSLVRMIDAVNADQNVALDLTFSRVTVASADRAIALIGRTPKVTEAVQVLVAAPFIPGGRSAFSPDVALVNESGVKILVQVVIQQASRYLAGDNGETPQPPDAP
ncbi:uncharacterized protein N7459_003818 [Penicillium hispanicum]|uniref:uncharacterized protein n=1 Tax=Penicillium hispanicum TaxID=1080232 RepID=UPI002541E006|nr:uncharacterized protein N7459_003818 [Penicillium hispanicum]KAJ5584018.1 hypothetical protein N7459_003818 [Penicillium hispanicum]